MKVLIYGAKGWIGSQFVEIMKTSGVDYVEGLSRVDNVETLEEEIILTKPSHIIYDLDILTFNEAPSRRACVIIPVPVREMNEYSFVFFSFF